MKKMSRIFMIVLVLLVASSGAALASIWSSTSASVLYGDGYKFKSSEKGTILTIEHASGWSYGDNFFFFDTFQPLANGTDMYGEWHPRLSMGKIFKNETGSGFFKDVLIATELNVGNNWRAYLYGLGFDFNIPYFQFFALNIFIRDDKTITEDTTYQISPSWNIPFNIGGTMWSFGGFLDYSGPEGDTKYQFLAQPQLLLDVSNFADKPGNLFVGIEYQYWKNKFGVEGVDENFVQFMGKWFF